MAVNTQLQVRRGTASQWTSTNPTLAAGEFGFETDTGKFKIGTGSTAWTSLGYAVTDGDISGVTAGTGLSGGGTAGTVTLSVDTAVVATTNNTLTMSNKTLTSPVISSISNTGTLTLPTSTDTLVGRATTDTLTNKSISGSSNTLTNIGNGSLTNSSITINGSSVSLGGTVTISGESFSPFMLMGA